MDKRLFFLMSILLLAVPFVVSESETLLNIPNTPPVFMGPIPNFSFAEGYLEDAFDLDDYFMDLQDDLSYYFNSTSIDVVIDSENMVSFYPSENFLGIGSVVFIANDGEFNVSSNEVFVGVGVDLTPPIWFNPRKSIDNKIYQGTNLSFMADWVDNFALGSYYLSINELGDWFDYSGVFSGRENTSISTIQIVAPPGKIVQWKICGFDLAMNMNCTEVYDFMVSYPPPSPPSDGGDYEGNGSSDVEGSGDSITGENIRDLYEDVLGSEDVSDFSIDVDSFLVEIKQGTSVTRAFEIVNGGTKDLSFKIYVEGAKEMILLSSEAISLNSGESKVVTVDFIAELSTLAGQYYGSIVVEGPETVVIPVVINVNDANLDFEVVVDVLSDYENVKPGREVVALINITNSGDAILSDIKLLYSIKDFYGNIYDSFEEVVSLDTGLVLEKKLIVPEEILLGKYLFYASVSNEKDIAISSDIFTVGLTFVFEAFLRSSSVFIIIFLLSSLSIVLSFRYRTQKLKERALNLYVKLHEMREFIKDGDYDKAASSYVSIKKIYGERVSEDILKDKKKLSLAIEQLAKGIDFEEVVDNAKEDSGDSTDSSNEKKSLDIKKVEEKKIEENLDKKEIGKEVKIKEDSSKKELEKEKNEDVSKKENIKEKKVIKKEINVNIEKKEESNKGILKKEDPLKKTPEYKKLVEIGKKRGDERGEFLNKIREKLKKKNDK